MADEKVIKRIFKESIKLITGFKDKSPLGTIRIFDENNAKYNIPYNIKCIIAKIFHYIIEYDEISNEEIEKRYDKYIKNNLFKKLLNIYNEAFSNFISFYKSHENYSFLLRKWNELKNTENPEIKAKSVTEIWLPELSVNETKIIEKWKLKEVVPENKLIQPENVAIQLNALYTIPEKIPQGYSENIKKMMKKLNGNFGEKISDYDHPVPLFVDEKRHELIKCLRELDSDIEFEKSKSIFREKFKLCVIVSISVTYKKLEKVTSAWVKEMIKRCRFKNLRCLVIGEEEINLIKDKLLKRQISVFSVSGKYAKHFNALKYIQLLLEKGYNIKAGFKLDTDEGIRSEDLFNATGKTWFQTMCHNLWGANAVDYKGKSIKLGINIGEYINNTDITKLGYKKSMRVPDVKIPDSYISKDIFFHKTVAHGKTTFIYNRFNGLNNLISHPVVKGGAYGITNDSLKKFKPFAFSEIGRAEDQGFYISSISKGLKGIFNPDLRIAHYKEHVSLSEKRTEVSRFIGDMYRLILFEHIVNVLDVKEEIDPMPGIFAGKLARTQAFFSIIYRAYYYCTRNQVNEASTLLESGIDELEELKRKIDSGKIKKDIVRESRQWEEFVEIAEKINKEESRVFFENYFV